MQKQRKKKVETLRPLEDWQPNVERVYANWQICGDLEGFNLFEYKKLLEKLQFKKCINENQTRP